MATVYKILKITMVSLKKCSYVYSSKVTCPDLWYHQILKTIDLTLASEKKNVVIKPWCFDLKTNDFKLLFQPLFKCPTYTFPIAAAQIFIFFSFWQQFIGKQKKIKLTIWSKICFENNSYYKTLTKTKDFVSLLENFLLNYI